MMKKLSRNLLLLSLFLFSITSCDNSKLDVAKMILVGEEQVKSQLRDPNSANFKNQFIGNKGDVCGEVNSKNGFGGYTGFQRYAVLNGSVVIEGGNLDSSGFSSIWASYCRK